MAKIWYTPGTTPATASIATLGWIGFLKAQGVLTHRQSGDGVSIFSANPGDADVFAPGVLRSWGRYRLADGQREWVFQVGNDGTGNTGRALRVKYSHGATFSQAAEGGATSFNSPPSATDQQFLGGSGNDVQASPSALSLYAAHNTYKVVALCDNAAPYGFWVAVFTNTTGARVGFFMLDPLKAGTLNATDVEPYIHFLGGNAVNQLCELSVSNSGMMHPTLAAGSGGSGNGRCATWWRKGLSGEAWSNAPMSSYGAYDNTLAADFHGAVGLDSIVQKDVLAPIAYVRHVTLTPSGYKGQSSLCRSAGVERAAMSTLSVLTTTSKEYLAFGSLALDWNGTDPVL